MFSTVIMALFLLVLSSSLALGLQNGRIGILYAGCIARSRPFWLMRSDPLFRTTFVPATLRDWMMSGPMPAQSVADIHRMVRIYMPRTLDQLTSNFDVIVLSDADVLVTGPYIHELAEGVSKRRLGLFMGGGWESFGGNGLFQPWGDTPVGQLLPTGDVVGYWDESPVQHVVFDRPNHQLITSIPWDWKNPDLSAPIKWHHNLVTVKPGADQLAHVEVGSGREDPLMITWTLPDGARVFALTSEIHRFFWVGGEWGNPWTYAYDLGSNLMIYLDRRPVPQDVYLVHEARSKIQQIRQRRALLMSLLDFAESFGANTNRILSSVAAMDKTISEGDSLYLKLDYEGMLKTYSTVEQMLKNIEAQAVKLKERALIWVYTIEWVAVSATTTLCGFVLWSLMVRRRYYRPVRVSRMPLR